MNAQRKSQHHNHSNNNNNNNHHHHRQKPKWNKKSSAKNIIPKNVLKFPQHLPVHILDLDVNEMDMDDEEPLQTVPPQTTTPEPTTTIMTSSSSEAPVETTTVVADVKTTATTTVATSLPANILNPMLEQQRFVLDDKATSVPVYGGGGDLMVPALNNNTVRPVILVDDKSIIGHGVGDKSDESDSEKGYYEKTIVNKNGVFIENIRKITNIDQRILGGTVESTESTGDNSKSSDSSSETINRKSIELMNAPVAHSQHYVITSSGQIEKTDTLTNDDLLPQYSSSLTSNSNNNNNKNFNTNKDYNRGQEEEEQQQEPNSNGELALANEYIDGPTTAVESTSSVAGEPTDSPSPAVSSTVTSTTISNVASNNCIVMGKLKSILLLY